MIVRVEYLADDGAVFVVLVDTVSGEVLDYPGVCWASARYRPAKASLWRSRGLAEAARRETDAWGGPGPDRGPAGA